MRVLFSVSPSHEPEGAPFFALLRELGCTELAAGSSDSSQNIAASEPGFF
jgi:hypothetical protein